MSLRRKESILPKNFRNSNRYTRKKIYDMVNSRTTNSRKVNSRFNISHEVQKHLRTSYKPGVQKYLIIKTKKHILFNKIQIFA